MLALGPVGRGARTGPGAQGPRSSSTEIGSRHSGQVPPTPTLRMKVPQSSHRCWPSILAPQPSQAYTVTSRRGPEGGGEDFGDGVGPVPSAVRCHPAAVAAVSALADGGEGGGAHGAGDRYHIVTQRVHAASSWAWCQAASYSAGGMSPQAPWRRAVFHQCTQAAVATSTSSRQRHGPRRWMSSFLYRPLTVSARALKLL